MAVVDQQSHEAAGLPAPFVTVGASAVVTVAGAGAIVGAVNVTVYAEGPATVEAS